MTWAHHAVLAAFALSLGAAVGSFLNVCIWRLPRGESVLRPRSRCPNCGTPIAARDNVPVLGWLALRGRCRSCAWPIPARYPLVEAGVALAFAGVVLVDVSLAPADPLERGALVVLAALGYHMTLTALLVLVAMIARDERRGVAPPPPSRHLAGGTAPAWLVLAAAAAVVPLAALAGADPLGSALNALLLSVCVLRAVPRRWAVGRVF